VALAGGGAVLGEPEVGELGVVVLPMYRREENELSLALMITPYVQVQLRVYHVRGSHGGFNFCAYIRSRSTTYRVEEDVGGLEVAVDDLPLRRVQEREAAGGPPWRCGDGGSMRSAGRRCLLLASNMLGVSSLCCHNNLTENYGFIHF
jgi:hypothetical protein